MAHQDINIVALSDTHCMHYDKRLGLGTSFISNTNNILIHAGDWGVRGSMGEVHHFSDFLEYYSDFYKAIIFISGNHDKEAQNHPDIFKSYFKDLKNVYYLQDSSCEIEGIKFWGSPWTIQYHGGFNKTREQLQTHWDIIPEDTDVLVTHSPPYGIMDIAKDQKLGCKSLL